MGFLRRNNKSNKADGAPSISDASVTSTTSSKFKFRLFANKSKTQSAVKKTLQSPPTERQQKHPPEMDTGSSQQKVDVEIEQNITVDSIESVVVAGKGNNNKSNNIVDTSDNNQQEPENSTSFVAETTAEGTELMIPHQTVFGEPDHPDDEPPFEQQHHQKQSQHPLPPSQNEEKDTKQSIEEMDHGDKEHEGNDEMTKEELSKQQPSTGDTDVASSSPKNSSLLAVSEDEDDITENKNKSPQPETHTPQRKNRGVSARLAETLTGAFLQTFTCTAKDAENCATLPGNIGGIAMPATACQPIINQQASKLSKEKHKNPHPLPSEYFNDQFAIKFLDVSQRYELRSLCCIYDCCLVIEYIDILTFALLVFI
jgi:hypothetical protein